MRHFLKPVAWLDPPVVLNTAVTSIPASSSNPVQVVASLAFACHAIEVKDSTGEDFEIMVGAVGKEARVALAGGGIDGLVEVMIPRGSRVSLRNTQNTIINSGKTRFQFMGAQ